MKEHSGFQAYVISVLSVTICLEAIDQYSVDSLTVNQLLLKSDPMGFTEFNLNIEDSKRFLSATVVNCKVLLHAATS